MNKRYIDDQQYKALQKKGKNATHMGDSFPDIEDILIKHLGKWNYDELLRPNITSKKRSRDARWNFDGENHFYCCAVFISLLSFINLGDSLTYQAYVRNVLAPMCGKGGLYSREPYGLNWYKARKYKWYAPEWLMDKFNKRPEEKFYYNRISRDEYIMLSYCLKYTPEAQMIVEHGLNHFKTYDDLTGKTNLRYRHPNSNFYFYRLAAEQDPSFLETIAFKINNLFVMKTKHPDGLVKHFVKVQLLDFEELKNKKLYLGAFMEYFSEGHPFKKLAFEVFE